MKQFFMLSTAVNVRFAVKNINNTKSRLDSITLEIMYTLNVCHAGIYAVLVLLLFAASSAFSEITISTPAANQSDYNSTTVSDSGEKLNFPFAKHGKPGIPREQALKRLAKQRESKHKNLENLPKPYYTSPGKVDKVPLSWFNENIEKANEIVLQFQTSTGAWTYQDVFVAAFRFESLCRWVINTYPEGNLKLCEKINVIKKFEHQMLINYPELQKKKPWEWMFIAEEEAFLSTKHRRTQDEK